MTPPRPTRPTSQRIDVAGWRTCVQRCGDGPPILLLPSILIRIKTYLWLIERLRRRHTVYAAEPPGSGEGATLDEPWSFQRYAEWIIQLLDVLKLPPLPVLAHSNSAPAAILAAAAHPQRFSHLILADATAIAPTPVWQLAAGRFVDGVMEAPFSMNALRDVFFNAFHHPSTLFNQIRLASECDVSAAAPQVKVPTLIAWGRLDFTFRVSAARKLHSLIPRSTLYVCEYGSHDWLVQWAGEFAPVVEDFLTRT